jgi:PKD repeat protein
MKYYAQQRHTLAGLCFFLLCIPLLQSCYKEQAQTVKADFSVLVENNSYSVPVKVALADLTTGADTYSWSFEGADPASASRKDPGTIEYDTPGTYTIRLDAWNSYGGRDSKSFEIVVDAPVVPAFVVTNSQSWYPDAIAAVTNTTTGATSWEWSFDGGSPATFTGRDPGNVVFSAPGDHRIRLTAGNGRVSYSKDTVVTVLPDLANIFDITWATADNDMQVPFTAIMQNRCVGATRYQWSCPGGNPATSADQAPSVSYSVPGTYTVTLTASNDKKSATSTRTVTLLPDCNLFSFTDVILGINTAQNSIGCYFSSIDAKVLKNGEITADNGKRVDFAYFGFNNSFSRNRFISPDEVQNYTFAAIPGAIHTATVNKQENCGCAQLTASQFDAISNGSQLTTLSFPAMGVTDEFDTTVTPRVVTFRTQDGRTGAIRVKRFVTAGSQSYIVCDIKITKKG